MPWLRIDDQFPDHPKVAMAGPLAGWLFVCGTAYCARYLTDGFIPAAQVRRLADVDNAAELAERLVSVGLWEHTDGGYIVHDYLDYNPSAEQVKAEREAAKQRMSKRREQPANDTRSSQDFGRSSGEVRANKTRSSSSPSPSRTVPNQQRQRPATDTVPSPLPLSPSLLVEMEQKDPGRLLTWFRKTYPEHEPALTTSLQGANGTVRSQAAYLKPVILAILSGNPPNPLDVPPPSKKTSQNGSNASESYQYGNPL